MASDDLRARIAEALRGIRFGLGTNARYGLSGSEVEAATEQLLPFAQAELASEQELSHLLMEQRQQMAAERYVWQERGDRYRAAWMGARNRAQGLAQRYRYERKLCDAADLRATKAIRKQLAVEVERDKALTALEAVREAQSLGEALAAVAKHDGLTRDLVAQPTEPSGIRGLLEHVGIDVAGRVITVDGVPIDDIGQPQRASVPGVEACYSGRFCVSWGFCHRCAPNLTEEAGCRFKETDGSSEAYAAIVTALTLPCGYCGCATPASECTTCNHDEE